MVADISTSYGRYAEEDVLARVLGARVVAVNAGSTDDALLSLETTNGTLTFFHQQDCCEGVDLESPSVEEVAADLVGGEIVACEARSSDEENPPNGSTTDDSYTWTFYEIRTTKGDVTLRFLGQSNGYYSESVDVAFTPIAAGS